jgi:hypothetical protein
VMEEAEGEVSDEQRLAGGLLLGDEANKRYDGK